MLDLCKKNPCKNGGTCRSDQGGYTCSCVPQWTGKDCEQGIVVCNVTRRGQLFRLKRLYFQANQNSLSTTLSPIHEKAILRLFSGSLKDCNSYIISSPDVNECNNKPCGNGASCVNSHGGYTCQCAAGWTGAKCDQGRLLI